MASEETKLISAIENNGHLVDEGLDVIQKAESYYHSKDTVTKQQIVSSIYPEKLIFDKSGYRTPKTINVVRLLSRFGEASKGNKKGKDNVFNYPSLQVDPEGFEPSASACIINVFRGFSFTKVNIFYHFWTFPYCISVLRTHENLPSINDFKK